MIIPNMNSMTSQEKKDLIKKRLSEGDKRSYNEIAADLELELWSMRFSRPLPPKIK